MTYAWAIHLMLYWLLIATAIGALVFFTLAIFKKVRRKRFLLNAVYCLAALPVLFATNFLLVYLVAIRPMVRDAQIARQHRIEAASVAKSGNRAPTFCIHVIGGSEEFSLDELRGKVVLLNFFATWCGPCIQELPDLQGIWNEYGNREDFAMLVIGREESDEAIRSFAEKHGYSFPIAADSERSVFSLYAESLIPRTYLIGRDGTIRVATTGYDEAELRSLKKVLDEELRTEI